jgi:hypothetical protein
MNLRSCTLTIVLAVFSISCGTKTTRQIKENNGLNVTFINREAERKIDVMIGGKLFTSYCWPDGVFKPILYPVLTSAGTEITRGFPLNPRPGESTDHRHQIGIWFNYGKVNGLDFWGNGSTGQWGIKSGEIKHISIEKISDGTGEGSIITNESWVDSTGKELLSERTGYNFSGKGTTRIIDRITTLTATGDTVFFKDTKEGMFGIRVAHQLELPAQGVAENTVPGEGGSCTGNYRSSEGITGEAVWGTRAKWMDLYGRIGNETVSLVVCDHSSNQSYPTYWHARGYGLFSANPLGAIDFTQGKEIINFNIPSGKSATFRYRVIVNSGADLTDYEINSIAEDFAKKY